MKPREPLPPHGGEMDGPTDDDLEEMLAGGSLSGGDREEVLASVLGSLAGERRTRTVRRRRGWLAAAAAAAAALALGIGLGRRPEFQSKGMPCGSFVELGCTTGPREACPHGGELAFRVQTAEPGFLVAYADRTSSSGPARIWYFSADTEAPPVPRSSSPMILSRAVRVGDDHPAGAYLAHILLVRRPLARAEALSPNPADVILHATAQFGVAP